MRQCVDCLDELDPDASPRTRLCPTCRRKRRTAAVRRSQAKTDHELRASASQQGRPWDFTEDAMLYTEGLSIADIARTLGRTRAAVMNRRRSLAR